MTDGPTNADAPRTPDDQPETDAAYAPESVARQRATEYVLQRYYLADLREAQARLTPAQYQGVLREIDDVAAQLTAPRPQPRPAQPGTRGVSTPFGPLLPVTGLLLVAIWIVFILETIQPGGSQDPGVQLTFGATDPTLLANGQYWRLLAACFVHIGFLHVASNSIALIWLGSLAERLYGPVRFAALYLAAGVAGNIVVGLAQNGGAGASGAIFGLLGALLAGTWRNRRILDPRARQQIASSLATMLVLNIAISFLPGIGWSAHLGGAITGAILALLIPFRSPGERPATARAASIASIILIVLCLAPLLTYPNAH